VYGEGGETAIRGDGAKARLSKMFQNVSMHLETILKHLNLIKDDQGFFKMLRISGA